VNTILTPKVLNTKPLRRAANMPNFLEGVLKKAAAKEPPHGKAMQRKHDADVKKRGQLHGLSALQKAA
jgi:hypothetical protein